MWQSLPTSGRFEEFSMFCFSTSNKYLLARLLHKGKHLVDTGFVNFDFARKLLECVGQVVACRKKLFCDVLICYRANSGQWYQIYCAIHLQLHPSLSSPICGIRQRKTPVVGQIPELQCNPGQDSLLSFFTLGWSNFSK